MKGQDSVWIKGRLFVTTSATDHWLVVIWTKTIMFTARFWMVTVFLLTLKLVSSLHDNSSVFKDSYSLPSHHCSLHQLRTAMGNAFNPEIMMDENDKITEDAKRAKDPVKADKYSKPPWACITNYKWIDLGIEYFPRFVRTSFCPPIQCWFGMFTCKGKPYRMTVLRRTKSNTTEDETTEDPCLLDQRKDRAVDDTRVWEFKTIIVSLCCSCTL